MNRLIMCVAAGAISVGAWAQSVTIKGKVMLADDPLPAAGAMVRLNAADTAKKDLRGRTTATDGNGLFTLNSREAKNDVTISYLGYTPKSVAVPVGSRGAVDLGVITLEPMSEAIERVEIVAQASMAKVAGDTTQYNAAAFKTNPDATAEDLLKKMPGVSTDENGKVQAQGQEVTKVLVNGKEYFDSDPSAALKNLPVDAVESIQIFDSQSDAAKFSGFDDGERVRTVNIVTKAGVTNSFFGKAYAGGGLFAPWTQMGGTAGRYAGGLGLNFWRGDHRLTIIAQANNVNNQGFTLGDVSSSGGGRRSGGGRGRNTAGGTDISGFSTPVRGGIQASQMVGLNYNGQFGSKFKMSAAYMYNGVGADIWNKINQTFVTTPRVYESENSSGAFQHSHSFEARTEWNPSSTNRITFNPSVSYSNNFGSSTNWSQTYLDEKLSNSADNRYDTKLERLNANADLWWQHSFGGTGRTLSVGGVVNGRRDMGNREQKSYYYTADAATGQLQRDSIVQIGSVWGDGYTLTGSATYTEPLSAKSRLSANYSITYDKSISDKQGWNWDELTQHYSLVDTTTTNYFNRNYTTHVAGLGYTFVEGKALTLNATVNYQNALLNNAQTSPSASRSGQNSYRFQTVLPSLRVSWNPSTGHNLNLMYNSNSIFPSVNQLQDVLNVDNPLQVSKGNPNLKQSYSNTLMLRYSYANTAKNINFWLMGFGNLTDDYISTHRIFLTQDTVINGTTLVRGAQYSEPVNLSGYVSARMMANVGFGIKPIKSNLNFQVGYSYGRTPSKQNNIDYVSNSNRINFGVSLTSNISENIDFTLYYRPGMNYTTAGTGAFDRYVNHNVGGNVNWIFAKYFFVNADAQWVNSLGTQASYTQHYALVNAAVGAKFFKNRAGELRLACYDILDQNRSVYQSSADTYTQLTQTNILRQYFMLSFTYKFDTRKGNARQSTSDSGSSSRGGMYGPYPGAGGPPHP